MKHFQHVDMLQVIVRNSTVIVILLSKVAENMSYLSHMFLFAF